MYGCICIYYVYLNFTSVHAQNESTLFNNNYLLGQAQRKQPKTVTMQAGQTTHLYTSRPLYGGESGVCLYLVYVYIVL